MKKSLLLGSCITLLLSYAKPIAAVDLFAYCQEEYLTNANCPPAVCRPECQPREEFDDCLMVCLPLDCVEISAKDCPTDVCQLLEGCNGEKVCYPVGELPEPSCGDLGFTGNASCCEGLVKRCGLEFLDTSCDMEGEFSIYSVPVCVPCGDGVCTNFENRCNCPEDCKESS